MRVAKSEVLRCVSLGMTGLLANLPHHTVESVRQQLRTLTAFGDDSDQEKGSVNGDVGFSVFGATIALRAVGVKVGAPELAQIMLDELDKQDARANYLLSTAMLGLTGRDGLGDKRGGEA